MKTEEALVSLACFAVGCVGFLLLEPGGGGVSCMGSKGCHSGNALAMAWVVVWWVIPLCAIHEALKGSFTKKGIDAKEYDRRAKFLSDHEAEMDRRRKAAGRK